jgi:CBS domain-containing protein
MTTNSGRTLVRDLPIAEVMRRPVVTVDEHCSAGLALRELLICGIRHLVVVDSSGRGVGMLADRILAACWADRPGALDSTNVVALISDRKPFVSADASISSAAGVMRDCGLDAVAVLDAAGLPIGVLTTTDLMALIAEPALAHTPTEDAPEAGGGETDGPDRER